MIFVRSRLFNEYTIEVSSLCKYALSEQTILFTSIRFQVCVVAHVQIFCVCDSPEWILQP